MDADLKIEPAAESIVFIGDESVSVYSEAIQPRRKMFPPKSNPNHEESEFKKPPSTKSVTFSTAENEHEELALRRQELELFLSSVEIDDSLSTDAHRNLQLKYDQLESTLEAFIYYIDSVNLEMKACCRLCQQLNGLIGSDKALLDTTRKICDGFAETTRDKLNSLLDDKNDVEKYIEEYKERKEDFKVGTHNFRLLLNVRNLSDKQLDRLQDQYDRILVNYQHSKCMLDQHVPNIISQRTNTLLNCFSGFSEDLERLANERSYMSELFQHFVTISGDLMLKRKIDDRENDETKSSNCTL